MTEGYKLGNPSDSYLKTIEEGYIDAGFDLDILYNAVKKTLSQMENFEEVEKHEPEQGDIFGMKWW
jgi:hypothetical protein